MTKVTTQLSVSLDGCYSGPRYDGTDPAGWLASTEAAGFFRVTRWVVDAYGWRERQGFAGGERDVNSEIVEEQFAANGAYVMGRRMFDGGEVPWGEEPPFRAPVFVVTNRPRPPLERKGGTTFTFVTDGIAGAVEQAKAAAGGKDVGFAGGGRLVGQAFAAGHIEQVDLHIVPVVVGDGQRLFDPEAMGLAAKRGIELVPERVVDTPAVTHVRYRVVGQAPLELDDRGRGDTTDAA
jgi:dihydrofolate reductase